MNNLAEGSPKDKSNVIAEITLPFCEKYDLDAIKEKTIEGLVSIGIIKSPKRIIFQESE